MCSQDWKDSPDGPGRYHLALLKHGADSYTRGVGFVYPDSSHPSDPYMLVYELKPPPPVDHGVLCDVQYQKTYFVFDGNKLQDDYDDVRYLAIDPPTLPRLSVMVRQAIFDRNKLKGRLETFKRDNLSMDDLMEYLKDINYSHQPSLITSANLIEYASEAVALYLSRKFNVPEFSHHIEVDNTDRADKSH